MKVKMSTISYAEYTQVTLSNTRITVSFRSLSATKVAVAERAKAMLPIVNVKEKRILSQFLKQMEKKC